MSQNTLNSTVGSVAVALSEKFCNNSMFIFNPRLSKLFYEGNSVFVALRFDTPLTPPDNVLEISLRVGRDVGFDYFHEAWNNNLSETEQMVKQQTLR